MVDVLHITGAVLRGVDDEVGECWVLDGRVTYERPTGAHDVTTVRGYALPGLVDAHCHIGLDSGGAVDRETARRQAETDRDAGTLLIRDAGSPADTRWIDDEADLPRIIRAGRHLARPKRYVRNYAHEIEPEDLAAYMRAQARAGDGWVKLIGDWIDRETGDLAPLWPADALRAGMAAAHAEGARVTAHCFGEECLPDLLAAGIDGIEHGTGFTEETIAVAAAGGVAVVPTLVNIATFPDLAAPARGRFDVWADHMVTLHATRYRTIGALLDAGVAVYAGTDAGGSIAHGRIVDELLELERAGLGTAGALAAGAWASRTWLGRPGIGEGDPADLLVTDDDPRTDLHTLRAPRVILRGSLRT